MAPQAEWLPEAVRPDPFPTLFSGLFQLLPIRLFGINLMRRHAEQSQTAFVQSRLSTPH